jgi:hypothetical protein
MVMLLAGGLIANGQSDWSIVQHRANFGTAVEPAQRTPPASAFTHKAKQIDRVSAEAV